MILRTWFECWRDPAQFFCTAWEQIRQAGNVPPQYLRDAYVAGLFARIWNCHERCEVRLFAEPDRFSDAQLRTEHHTMNIEIAIVDKQDRRTWAEHREWVEMSKRGEVLPADSPEQRFDNAREAIPRILKKKVGHYLGNSAAKMGSVHLVLYLMQGQTPIVSDPVITADEMELLAKPYNGRFESIWVLRGIENVRLWPERKILAATPGHDPFDCRGGPHDSLETDYPTLKWDGRRAAREGAIIAVILTLIDVCVDPPTAYTWAGYAGAFLGRWTAIFMISAMFCFVVNRYTGRR